MKLLILLGSACFVSSIAAVSDMEATMASLKLKGEADAIDDDRKALESADDRNDELILDLSLDAAILRAAAESVMKTKHIPSEFQAIIDDQASRNLNCVDHRCHVPISLKGIWHYGCWCNFGNDLLEGNGMPMNKHDELCQNMQLCLRCAKMDAEDDGTYTCDPKNDRFNAAFRFGRKKLGSDCKKRNSGDTCGVHLCMCEMTLIADLIALIWEGYTYDPQYLHKKMGGTFSPSKYCLTSTATGPTTKECCGSYPTRFPYSVGGTTECCNNNGYLYNSISEHCCSDSVKQLGDPC